MAKPTWAWPKEPLEVFYILLPVNFRLLVLSIASAVSHELAVLSLFSKFNSVSGILPISESLFPIKKRSRMYREDVESQTYVPFEETKRQMVSPP